MEEDIEHVLDSLSDDQVDCRKILLLLLNKKLITKDDIYEFITI